MTTLPQVPSNYLPAIERERSRKIEAGLRGAHKRGQDVEVGQGRLILTSDDGIRYEIDVTNDGLLQVVTIDGVELAGPNQSLFDELRVAARTPIIELNSAYGTSALRDVEILSGSAAISASSTGEILLSTGATASSTAILDSAERLRYMPGYNAEVGIGIRIPTLPTGNQEAKWGIRNPGATEGLYFGVDATGFYIARLRGGTETKVRQADFNINPLDGTGPKKYTLDLAAGHIFQIDFAWYGYGQILWEVFGVPDGQSRQTEIDLHQEKVDGTTSIQSPNLPIFVEATNGGDATDFDVYVGGRQGAVVGAYLPKFRTTGQESAVGVATSTTTIPLISFRNKSGFEDRSVRIDAATAQVASEDHIIEFYVDTGLTGASWGTPTNSTASETGLEVDTSATALSNGTLFYSFFAKSGQANQESATSSALNFDVPENQTITMAARTVTGTGTVTAFLRMREEW